ncbi:MAG: hypothetical protein ACFB6R_05535 [Alphaproteobacteria bacterium]
MVETPRSVLRKIMVAGLTAFGLTALGLILSGCQSTGSTDGKDPQAQTQSDPSPSTDDAASGGSETGMGATATDGPVSSEAVDFIIAEEVGGRAIYEGRLGGRPHWDGGGSGILIGFGYNLGTVQPTDVRRVWGGVLSTDEVERLALVAGIRPSGVDRLVDRAKMEALADTVVDIQIAWDDAMTVFKETMLPVRIGRVRSSLENTDALHPHSFGALVSLVYNRGATFGRSGDRFREMRAIKAHMANRDFTKIPGELRSMARIWPTVPALQRRRAGEADLFQKGLDAQSAGS